LSEPPVEHGCREREKLFGTPPLDAISSIKIVIRLSNHLSAATVSADLAIDAEVDLPALASPLIVRSRRPVR